ncbi:N-acetylmuramoyl-L-alanine amidase [Luteimonas sp. 22616]|uniref:N-acetylmuramoyl-L-alanine amidase n=1 Tax=Luteimonas sp. 22616 TaxID=3453951 RepID=UPI003F856AF7
MRAKGISVQQVILGLALLAALCWNLAHASEINNLQVSVGATGTRAEIALDAQVEYRILSLSNPDRLVVDLPGVDPVRGLKLPAAAGLVKDVRTGHPVPGTTRIVFDLHAPVVALKPHFEPAAGGTRLVLEWPGDNTGDPIARIAAATASVPVAATNAAPPTGASAQPASPPPPDPAIASAAATSRLVAAATTAPSTPLLSTPPAPAPSGAVPAQPPTVQQAPGTVATGVPTRIATGVPTPVTGASQVPADAPGVAPPPPLARRSGMRPLIVAIDPGHGGQDPGAIGKSGRREKDVTLAVGRELARQINATPGLKAYMTRDKDVFIPLNRRAQLARAAKADIFVSIHADAAENRSASGASVYVLSLKGASSQRARWLADKENSADLIGGRMPQSGNTLASVLLDLTQSGHMKASEDAARHVLDSLGDVGNTRRVERANFAVLRTADMPSMLVETAYISNPTEERLLTDPAYQRKLATAILRGVDTYFLRQPPPGTLYAARASAQADSGAGGSP